MELLRFSKFKLQLLALISETRELRERERSTREELNLSVQRQKDTEAEFGTKFQEMQAELKSRDVSQRKLESKIKFLENDNVLLEKKQKELKETIDSLLQSRETFINIYEDSTCALKNSIQLKDRKLAVISDKIHAHTLLFDSIEKEAAAIKQLVDYVQQLVIEKEQVVAELKEKMDKVATYEKEFVDKIHLLGNNVSNYQHELQAKDTTVSELKEQLEAAKFNKWQPQIDELRKAIGMKDKTIQSLTSEKQELHHEIQSLELVLRTILDQNSLFLAKGNQEDSGISGEDKRLGSVTQALRKGSQSENLIEASMLHQDDKQGNDLSGNKHIFHSHLSESVCSGPQSTVNVLDIPLDGKKGNCTSILQCLDSESPTSEAEALEAAPARWNAARPPVIINNVQYQVQLCRQL